MTGIALVAVTATLLSAGAAAATAGQPIDLQVPEGAKPVITARQLSTLERAILVNASNRGTVPMVSRVQVALPAGFTPLRLAAKDRRVVRAAAVVASARARYQASPSATNRDALAKAIAMHRMLVTGATAPYRLRDAGSAGTQLQFRRRTFRPGATQRIRLRLRCAQDANWMARATVSMTDGGRFNYEAVSTRTRVCIRTIA